MGWIPPIPDTHKARMRCVGDKRRNRGHLDVPRGYLFHASLRNLTGLPNTRYRGYRLQQQCPDYL